MRYVFHLILCVIFVISGCSEQGTEVNPIPSEVLIGTRIWQTMNLNVSVFRNGDTIPEAKNNYEWNVYAKNGKACWSNYNYDQNINSSHGKLYNWYAVNDPRGLAPEGYHIASWGEWSDLISISGGELIGASKLRDKNSWGSKTNGDNSTKFTALPSGFCDELGGATGMGISSWWWSASEDNTFRGCAFSMNNYTEQIYAWRWAKGWGFYVRCVKN